MKTTLLNEMRNAVTNNAAKILTVDLVNELKGKKIKTIYFGYKDQDGVDEFIVGEVKKEIHANGKEGKLCLFTSDGRNTYIKAHEENEGAFTCSDVDRFVYFIEAGDINTFESINPDSELFSVREGHLKSKNGRKFYNCSSSYDAKINLNTGSAWSICHEDYNIIDFPTINQLLEKGELIDFNYEN